MLDLVYPLYVSILIFTSHSLILLLLGQATMFKPLATRLGRHRQLCPTAGVHVSPIQLGAMSIGDAWQNMGMGAMDKESSFKLLDAYYEAGGNFIDTANV